MIMDKKTLPVAPETHPCTDISYEIKPKVFEHWQSGIKAVKTANTISILDVIGEDYWGEGVTVKRISAALSAIGDQDVIVNLNSPGGDMFAGVAIYNLLRSHCAKVTINVLGIAASAASIIAMAGDEVRMGTGTFLMIHNCWVVGIGNRHDFARLCEEMRPFDKAMADIYAARSGLTPTDIEKIMDNETYLSAEEAIAQGFADELISIDHLEAEEETPQAALRKIDALLAKTNTPRSERRKLIKSLTGGKPCATASSTGMPSATEDINPEYLTKLQNAINAFASTTR